MKVPYYPESTSELYNYDSQVGGAMPVFRGKTIQVGSGIGGIFSKMLKGIVPVIKSVAKTAGKQLLHTGAKIGTDMIEGKKFSESARKNFSAGGKNLLENLTDAMSSPRVGGAKRKIKRKNVSKPKPVKTKRRRLNHDIFK